MTAIYYFSTIVFLIAEFRWFLSPIEMTKEANKFSEISKLSKGMESKDWPKEYISYLRTRFWILYIPLWAFIGLFTFQWLAFLLILMWDLLIIFPILKITKFSTVYTVVKWINSAISIAFCAFIIVNHYHLKIDLLPYFITLYERHF